MSCEKFIDQTIVKSNIRMYVHNIEQKSLSDDGDSTDVEAVTRDTNRRLITTIIIYKSVNEISIRF